MRIYLTFYILLLELVNLDTRFIDKLIEINLDSKYTYKVEEILVNKKV